MKKNVYLRMILTIGALIIILSGIRVAFATPDIAYMLETWVEDKREDSIRKIERNIADEQAKQTNRLKGEIQRAIRDAERQYEAFMQSEIDKRRQGVTNHANRLINSIDVEVETDEVLIQRLECLATKAQLEMDVVLGIRDMSELINCGQFTVDYKPEEAAPKEENKEEGAPVEEEAGTNENEPENEEDGGGTPEESPEQPTEPSEPKEPENPVTDSE